MVVVAIDKDKGSQGALKWAVDNLLSKGKSVTLLHVKLKQPASQGSFSGNGDASKVSKGTLPIDGQTKELFYPFRCFCTRKDVRHSMQHVHNLDCFSSKAEFCNVYVISKGKISSVRSASLLVPTESPSQPQNQVNPQHVQCLY